MKKKVFNKKINDIKNKQIIIDKNNNKNNDEEIENKKKEFLERFEDPFVFSSSDDEYHIDDEEEGEGKEGEGERKEEDDEELNFDKNNILSNLIKNRNPNDDLTNDPIEPLTGKLEHISDREMFSYFQKNKIKRNQYNSNRNLLFHCFLKYENFEKFMITNHKFLSLTVTLLCGKSTKKRGEVDDSGTVSIIDFQNIDGETPVHCLMKNRNQDKDTSLMLLIILMSYLPNLKLLDKHGKDVFDYAFERADKDFLEVLISHGHHKPFEHLIPNNLRYQSFSNLSLRIAQMKKLLGDNGFEKLTDIFMISEMMHYGSLSRAKHILKKIYWDEEVCKFLIPPFPLNQAPTETKNLPPEMILNSNINIVEEVVGAAPIYLGFYLGIPVALKTIQYGIYGELFARELECLLKLGGHNYSSFVKYYGLLGDNFLVVELCKYSLHHFVTKFEIKTFLRWTLIIKFIRQMLTAVDILHNNGIIHGNLSLKSFLVSLDNNLVLGNFGFIRNEFSSSATFTNNKGQSKQIHFKKVTRHSQTIPKKNNDIINLGIILWEFIANLISKNSDYTSALDKSPNGIKNYYDGFNLPLPANCPYLVKKLILKFFKDQPSPIPIPISAVDENGSKQQKQQQLTTIKKALKIVDEIENEYTQNSFKWDNLIGSEIGFDSNVNEPHKLFPEDISNGTLVYFVGNQNIYNDERVLKNVNDLDLSKLEGYYNSTNKNKSSYSKISTSTTKSTKLVSASTTTVTTKTIITKVSKKQFQNALNSIK